MARLSFLLLLVLVSWQAQAQVMDVRIDKMSPSNLDIPRGASKTVQFTWVAKAKSSVPLTVFVHYVGPNGQNSLGGGDHKPPVPTTSWASTVQYSRTISVPANAPLGTYQVKVGLYSDATGVRYRVTAGTGVTQDGETRYQIGTFRVVEATSSPVHDTPGTLFVSPVGLDTNSGTVTNPVKSLVKARDLARATPKDKTKPVTILLRGGVYRLNQPLELGPQDSNTVWAGYPGETSVLTGCKVLPQGWSRGTGWVNSIALPADMKFRTFFVNGQPQIVSRLPDSGWWKVAPTSSNSEFLYHTGPSSPDGLTSGDVLVRPYEWYESRLPLKLIDTGLKKVLLGKASIFPLGLEGEPRVWALENTLAGLTRPGQWCLEEKGSGNKLYWFSPYGPDPNTSVCEISNLVTLVNLVGSGGGDKAWVENIKFQHLVFHGTGRRVSSQQEGGDYTSHAIRMTQGVRGVEFRNDLFQDIGAGAIAMFDWSQGNLVTKCRFDRIGESGVSIIGDPGPSPYHNGGNRIEQNEFSNIGTSLGQSYAVVLAQSQNNSIGYNYIHGTSYAGIRLSGSLYQDWQAQNSPGVATPFDTLNIKPFIATAGNTIHHNLIQNSMQSLSDGGAIYTWGITGPTPNVIEHNLIENVGGPREYSTIGADVGIYFDDESDGYSCSHNAILNAGWGINLHGASRISLRNNITAFSRTYDIHVQPESYAPSPYNTDVVGHVFYFGPLKSWGTQWGDWSRVPLRTVDNNTYWRSGIVETYPGQDTNSKTQDPLFLDPWLKSGVQFSTGSPARARGNTDPEQISWQPVRVPIFPPNP